MKQAYKILVVLFISTFCLESCTDFDDSLNIPSDLQVQNFIWKGLNLYYLWQGDVSDLSDNRFSNQGQLNDFLYTKGTPEDLFQDLLFKPVSRYPRNEAVDRFSLLVNDYTYLENLFQGITTNNGVDFGLKYKSGSTTDIFGWVRYIIPNSDASTKAIHRGTIFYAIDGIPLTVSNYQSLLESDNYTLNLADYDNGNITPNGQSVTLSKTQLTENPVFYTDIIKIGNHKVAYLVYNSFTANFDPQLNDVFGNFLAAGANHLVLDLRYNSGGSVESATRLASMITGQFEGQLFAKEHWNQKIQSYYESNHPDYLVNNFKNNIGNGTAINSLRLSKVYILTSKSSASASELVINGLKPYINVIQIGDATTGKNVASVTLYDSSNFSAKNRNPSHRYAMQPLVLKMINKDGFGEYQDGLQPNIALEEDLGNLIPLGNTSEPLLSTALGHITTNGRMMKPNPLKIFEEFKDAKSIQPFGTDMYLNEVPKYFYKILTPFEFN